MGFHPDLCRLTYVTGVRSEAQRGRGDCLRSGRWERQPSHPLLGCGWEFQGLGTDPMVSCGLGHAGCGSSLGEWTYRDLDSAGTSQYHLKPGPESLPHRDISHQTFTAPTPKFSQRAKSQHPRVQHDFLSLDCWSLCTAQAGLRLAALLLPRRPERSESQTCFVSGTTRCLSWGPCLGSAHGATGLYAVTAAVPGTVTLALQGHTHRSRLLGGWVAGKGHQILERVLGVEMWRVPDGCVWEVGGGCLRQDGCGGEVQGRGWVGTPCDPTVNCNDGPVVLREAGEPGGVLGGRTVERRLVHLCLLHRG